MSLGIGGCGEDVSGGDDGLDDGEGCVPAGLEQPGEDVEPPNDMYASVRLVVGEPLDASHRDRVSLRLLPIGIDSDDVQAYANGCPVPRSSSEEELDEFLFEASGPDVPIELVAGSSLTLEMRDGAEVMYRRTQALPTVLPRLTVSQVQRPTDPDEPVVLQWNPVGVDELDGDARLELYAAHDDGATGSSLSDVDDALGQHELLLRPEWAHLELELLLSDGFLTRIVNPVPIVEP
ncbi:MAG: hypothetical protein K0V04_29220 [Deltaproteobacteria bacterium]|nr:hypothetical protein [Deltaproteobacteria bacterium]